MRNDRERPVGGRHPSWSGMHEDAPDPCNDAPAPFTLVLQSTPFLVTVSR